MTNKYNLSHPHKLIFIHGLNNNEESFKPLMKIFEDIGYETILITLPGHQGNRDEAKTLKEAQNLFEKSMGPYKQASYSVIAFSQGALLYQLWLKENPQGHPKKKIFLAPAFYIRNEAVLNNIVKLLPSSLNIMSLSPQKIRRYDSLRVNDYKILFDGVKELRKESLSFNSDTLILIDPKDELVNAKRLKKEHDQVQFVKRKRLKTGPGSHHILFHPEFFEKEAWLEFSRKLLLFLEN